MAEMPFLNGLFIGLVVGVIIGILLLMLHQLWLAIAAVVCGFGGGAMLGIINSYVRHTRISCDREVRSHGIFLRVDEGGKVVDSGNPIWGRKNVHWCGLPFIWEGNDFAISTTISCPVGNISCVSVEVMLRVFLNLKGFNPQELYDHVIMMGHGSVVKWLSTTFQLATKSTGRVQQACDQFANSREPVTFIEALTTALRELPFSGQPLSNISHIIATVKADSATYTAKALYK